MEINKKLNSTTILIGIIIIFSLLRIYIGQFLPSWIYTYNATCDDFLLIAYSDLYNHFNYWNILSLVKTISFPLFLYFVKISNISYKFWLSVIWISAGAISTYGISKFISKNKIILLFSYLFIIFLPISFDSMCGTRIYRNTLLAPFAIIFLSTLFIFINTILEKEQNNKRILIWSILLGLIFTFNFYIKEDGIINFPILIASISIVLIYKLFNEYKTSSSKDLIKIVVLCLIPFLIFSVCTIGYKEVNNHYFGIYEINTRTDGEIGEFYQNLLKINDTNKSTKVWVPISTLQKAWNASPTLQSRQDLFDSLNHSTWANGNMEKNPVTGDLITWSLRYSLEEVGLFNNETSANDFFKKVNDELTESFNNGTLEKSDNIFITDSANGKTIDEIKGLKLLVILGIKSCIFYTNITNFDVPILHSSQEKIDNNTKMLEEITHDHIITASDNKDYFNFTLPLELVKVDIQIYQIISYIIFTLSGIGFISLSIHQIKNRFKNRHLNILIIFELFIICTFLVQIFAIAWFTSWIELGDIYFFYLAASYGYIAVFEIFSIAVLSR